MAFTRDTVIDQRYRVIGRIGSGGMADVYCAEDLQLGRRIALKLLYDRFAQDDAFVERFRREASAAAGLQHPNVVGIFDRGEWDGTYYIAMELLEGRSLKDIVRDDGPLPPERAIPVALQILKALRFAHRRGIVHRDIKPHNVLVDEEGRVKVTDFGIALAGASDMTETGSIMGTAQYLSPEQAQGHPVDARADLYSVGVVLYEMLTGRVPFEGDSAVSIALKQVAEPPVPPSRLNPAVSPALEAVVMRALEKAPGGRFADADAFMAALEEVRGQTTGTRIGPVTAAGTAVPPPAVPVGLPGEAPPERGRSRWRWVVLGLVALAGVAVAAFLLLRPDARPVPNVVDQDASTAIAILENAGFDPRTERVTNDEVPADEVFRQDPRPGEEAREGETVTLVVSTGPGLSTIPEVAGLERRAALRAVRAAGFRTRTRDAASSRVPAGRVVRAEPEQGTELRRGRQVTLVVSSGPAQVTVPEVVGRPRAEARAELEAAGLAVEEQESESQDAEPGTVLAQDPAGGATLDRGSSVTLTVATEPAEVAVPDVTGEDVNDALDALTEAGFQPRQDTEPVETPDEDGRVLEQRPEAGQERERGSRVTIVVGDYEPPEDLDPDPNAPPDPDTPADPGGEPTPEATP